MTSTTNKVYKDTTSKEWQQIAVVLESSGVNKQLTNENYGIIRVNPRGDLG